MAITGFTITGAPDLTDPDRVQIIGTLTGTAGANPYVIPMRFIYPRGASPVLHRAVQEMWNSNAIESMGINGGAIIDRAFYTLQIPWLVNQMGFSYIGIEWSKFVTDSSVANGVAPIHGASLLPTPALPIPYNPAWIITQGTDGFQIMADASAFVRDPLALPFAAAAFAGAGLIGADAPPTAAKVIGYGCSVQAGGLIRNWAMVGNNTLYAVGPSYPAGLVFDAMSVTTNGATCRTLDNVSAPMWGQYTYIGGETPVGQGPLTNYSTESEMIQSEGIIAREAAPVAHYSSFELPGMAYLPGDFGFSWPILNNENILRPFDRAMIVALNAKIDGTALPASAWMDGSAATRATPFFAGTSYITGCPYPSGTTLNTFVGIASDEDGNFTGGVRLPYLRTTLPDGRSVGAPLGTYRGVMYFGEELRDNTDPEIAVTWTPPLTMVPFALLFTPMLCCLMRAGVTSHWEPALLNRRYRTAGEYREFVESGARHALDQRWITQTDYTDYVNTAAAMTEQGIIDTGMRRVVPPTPLIF